MTDKLWTREFVGMGMANFFYFISHWILVAALPIFIMDDLGKSQVEAGMALTFFQFGTTCCRPFAGRMIDGMHKQHVLFGASFILFLIMVGFGFAKSLEMVWGLRFIHGIIFALGTTSAAALASLILPLSRKGEGIGYFAVTANLAMVIGPLVGLLILNHLGKSCLLIFLALLALSAVFSGNSKKLPDSVVRPSRKVKKGFHISDFIERKALPSVILGGLVFFAYGGVLTFVPMYARSLGMGGLSGLFFMTFAVVIVLTRPLVGYLYDHHGPDAVIYPGLVLFSLGLVLFSLWNGPVLLVISSALLGIGFGALSPSLQTLAVQCAPPSRAGVATSTYFWSQDISIGLAGAVLGLAVNILGYSLMYLCICLPAGIIALIYYFRWRKYSGRK